MDEVRYTYFLHPHEFSTYTHEPHTCDLCGKEQAGYRGPFYGVNEIEFVCESCLAHGKLAEVDAFTNEGHVALLQEQLQEMHPNLSEADLKRIVNDRNVELVHKTPHVVTWQDFFWPAHCGDYCCFLKEAGKADLNPIAPEGRVHLLFEDLLEEDFEYLWNAVRPDSPADNSVAYSLGVYLFQCLHCQKYIVLHDYD